MAVTGVEAGAGPDATAAAPADGSWSQGSASAALAQVAAAIDGLLAVDLTVPGTGETLDLLRGVERQTRRLQGASTLLVGQIESRGLAAPAGQSSTAALLRQVVTIGQGDSYQRVRLAGAVCPSTGLSGAMIPPRLPLVAAALLDGGLGPKQADVVVRTLTGFPASVPGDVRDSVEQFLVEQGQVLDPRTFENVAREIALMADPDGTHEERNAHEKMEFNFGKRRPNGLTKVWGLLDDLTVEALRAAFGALGAPSAQRSPWDPPEAQEQPDPGHGPADDADPGDHAVADDEAADKAADDDDATDDDDAAADDAGAANHAADAAADDGAADDGADADHAGAANHAADAAAANADVGANPDVGAAEDERHVGGSTGDGADDNAHESRDRDTDQASDAEFDVDGTDLHRSGTAAREGSEIAEPGLDPAGADIEPDLPDPSAGPDLEPNGVDLLPARVDLEPEVPDRLPAGVDLPLNGVELIPGEPRDHVATGAGGSPAADEIAATAVTNRVAGCPDTAGISESPVWRPTRPPYEWAPLGTVPGDYQSSGRDPSESPDPHAPMDADVPAERRSAGTRRAQALSIMVNKFLELGLAPTQGGERPHLLVTVDEQSLRDRSGSGRLGYGDRIPIDQVRMLACDSQVVPAVLGGKSELLDVGRAMRSFNAACRRAILLRDVGCVFPGCHMPGKWAEFHNHLRKQLGCPPQVQVPFSGYEPRFTPSGNSTSANDHLTEPPSHLRRTDDAGGSETQFQRSAVQPGVGLRRWCNATGPRFMWSLS